MIQYVALTRIPVGQGLVKSFAQRFVIFCSDEEVPGGKALSANFAVLAAQFAHVCLRQPDKRGLLNKCLF